MEPMDAFAVAREWEIRLGFFVGIFALVALAEVFVPRRDLTLSKPARWGNNLALVGLNALILRLLFPAAAVGMALFAAERSWGLLNYVSIPYWLGVLVTVVAMDLAIYLQHVMAHAVPLFWQLHRVHHADLDFDVTTGARFHPLEMVLSMLIKLSVIALLGAPPAGVVLFEVLLNGTAMFNHANLRLPPAVDRVLRLIVVTPDMHRVHHSVEPDEANTNFGFNLPWWDRLFGTYRAQPRKGHRGMTVGVKTYRDPRYCDRLSGMLAMPFSRRAEPYPIGRYSG